MKSASRKTKWISLKTHKGIGLNLDLYFHKTPKVTMNWESYAILVGGFDRSAEEGSGLELVWSLSKGFLTVWRWRWWLSRCWNCLSKPFSVETFASDRDFDRLRTWPVGDAIGKWTTSLGWRLKLLGLVEANGPEKERTFNYSTKSFQNATRYK